MSMYVFIIVCVLLCVSVCMHVCKYMYVCLSVSVCLDVVYVCSRCPVCMCVAKYMYMRLYVYVCMHAYIWPRARIALRKPLTMYGGYARLCAKSVIQHSWPRALPPPLTHHHTTHTCGTPRPHVGATPTNTYACIHTYSGQHVGTETNKDEHTTIYIQSYTPKEVGIRTPTHTCSHTQHHTIIQTYIHT